jgi:hypothetical protein
LEHFSLKDETAAETAERLRRESQLSVSTPKHEDAHDSQHPQHESEHVELTTTNPLSKIADHNGHKATH